MDTSSQPPIPAPVEHSVVGAPTKSLVILVIILIIVGLVGYQLLLNNQNEVNKTSADTTSNISNDEDTQDNTDDTTDTSITLNSNTTIIQGGVFEFIFEVDRSLGAVTNKTKETMASDSTYCMTENVTFANSNITFAAANGRIQGCYPSFDGDNTVISKIYSTDAKEFELLISHSDDTNYTLLARYSFPIEGSTDNTSTLVYFYAPGVTKSAADDLKIQITEMVSTLSVNQNIISTEFDETVTL